jgi:hypothetical protein
MRVRTHVLTCLAALSMAGCMGAGNMDVGVPRASGPSQTPAPSHPTLGYSESALTLLPFSVRLAKVAAVLGVSPDDAVLAALRNARLELGDHDFANGVKPAELWSAAMVSSWVKALRPVCASTQMKTRYPSLPTDLPNLVSTAHGRPASPDDTALVEEALNGLTLDEATRYTSVCLAILASAEFVAR